jgi:hypothetical protein
MRLWIDDVRPSPAGWTWAKSSAAAISALAEHDVTEASFDHDLGGDDTSRRVVLWLCEHEEHWPTVVHVHSANPVGVEWLTGMINRYGPGITA